MPETTEAPAAKPELKSFEDAAAAFMKQAEVNEYGPGEDGEGTPEQQHLKEKAPAAPKAEKPAEKSEKQASDSRRAPAEVFQKEGEKKEGTEEKPLESAFDKFADPDFKNPGRSEQWKTLKEEGKTWERKAREYEAKLAEQPKDTKPSADFEKQLAERDAKLKEMSALVERANVEAHPEFRKKYVEGREALVNKAKTIIDDAGGNAEDIATALALSGKARVAAIEKAAEELSTFQQGRLAKVIDELEGLDAEAADKRAKSGDSWKEIQREQQERQQRESQEFSEKAIKSHESVKREMMKELEVLREVAGSDWWNEQGKNIIKKADEFFTGNEDIREASKAAVWKEAGPVYRELYVEERAHTTKIEAELAEAKKALEEAYGSGPSARGRIEGGGSKNKLGMTFEERVEFGE